MISLTSGERRALRARAHHLRPVVIIGGAGITAAVLREIEVNLVSHELIKIRAAEADRVQRRQIIDEICNVLNAFPVQHIGKIFVIFRPKKEPVETGGSTKGRGLARRPKRSYQMPGS